ncbi:MAG: DUF1343 domain-containing protein [bacterium]
MPRDSSGRNDPSSGGVQTGLDRLLADDCAVLRDQRLGLLVHPASVDSRLRHAATLLHTAANVDLRCLFGPQHGLRGETQDNMAEWDGFRDPQTGLPAYSLYGDTRQPTPEQLAGIDTLVIDLQDVGARYYTFIWSVLLCLQACAEAGKRVVVLDRPNPIGGALRSGNVLDPSFTSFVGMAPIPMRHSLTIGELAFYFCAHFELGVDLQVIWMDGWRRHMWFDDTGLPWVLPSPNIPTLDTATVYPGFCLLEGTELSEGRGTTRPFEIFGAPFIDPARLINRLEQWSVPGCTFRPLHFEPTFQKHAGRLCGGAQVHVTDRERFCSVLCATAALAAIHELWPDDFRWKQPPYEYETVKLPIDILAGGERYRRAIEAGRSPDEIAAAWEPDLALFGAEIQEFQHYV